MMMKLNMFCSFVVVLLSGCYFISVVGIIEDLNGATHILNIAREFKDSGTPADITKARKLYHYIVSNPVASKGTGVYTDALYEYSLLLEGLADDETDNDEHLYDASFELLTEAAEEGHAGAQHELAAAYNTGVYGGLVPVDPTRALLLEYMSSLSGHAEAHMGMGFKYIHGIGVKASCERALIHYEYAANEAIRQMTSSPTGIGRMELERGVTGGGSPISPFRGGHPLHSETSKLSDVFLSAATKGKQQEFDPELMEFYSKLADEGDVTAAYNLGLVYYYGTRRVDQDIKQAIYYLYKAASDGYTRSTWNTHLSSSNGGKAAKSGSDAEFGADSVGGTWGGGINNSSMVGNAVTNTHVLSARGLLGYILAKGQYFRAPEWYMPMPVVGGAPPSPASEGAAMAAAKQDLLGYLINTLQLGHEEMVIMLRYGAAMNEPNALAGLAYLTMTGSRCDTALIANLHGHGSSRTLIGRSSRLTACGRNNEHAAVMDFPRNTTKAMIMFAPLLNRHPDAGFYLGEMALSGIKMIEVKPLRSLKQEQEQEQELDTDDMKTDNTASDKKKTKKKRVSSSSGSMTTKVKSTTRVTRGWEGKKEGVAEDNDDWEHIVEMVEEIEHPDHGSNERSRGDRSDSDALSMLLEADEYIEGHDMRRMYKQLLRDEGVFSGRGAGAARSKKFELLLAQQRRSSQGMNRGSGSSSSGSHSGSHGGASTGSTAAAAGGGGGGGGVVSTRDNENKDADGVASAAAASAIASLLPLEPRKTHKLIRKLKNYVVHPDSVQEAAQALLMYVASSQRGNIQATHRLGHLLARGIGTQKSCPNALQSFRNVAERGDWVYELTAASRYVLEEGKYAAALRIYNKFALMGYESAQSNAAYVLSNLHSPSWLLPTDRISTAAAETADLIGTTKSASVDTVAMSPPTGDGPTTNSRTNGSIAIVPAPKWTAQQQYHIKRKGVVLGDAPVASSSDDDDAVSVSIPESEKVHIVGIVDVGAEPSHPSSSSSVDVNVTNSGAEAIPSNVTVYHHIGSALSSLRGVLMSAVGGSSTHLYSKPDIESRALSLYAQAALQGSGESYSKLGDMFYYGMAWLDTDKSIALEFYKVAAAQQYTNAIFSVGLMHEFGEGVPHVDFHLAKRYYDQAAEAAGGSSGGSSSVGQQQQPVNIERIPALVANQMLKTHQYLRLNLGEAATEDLIRTIGKVYSQTLFLFEDLHYVVNLLRRRWHRLPTLGKLIQQYTFYGAVESTMNAAVGGLESAVWAGERQYNQWIKQLFVSSPSSEQPDMSSIGGSETATEGDASEIIAHSIDFDTLLISALIVLFLCLFYLRKDLQRRARNLQQPAQQGEPPQVAMQ